MKYFFRRFITLITTVIVVALVTFLAFNVLPGDPALTILGVDASPAKVAALRASLGLDKSLNERFVIWIMDLIHGNLGMSIRFSTPVKDLIASRLSVTIALAILSIIIILGVSIPLGILSARKEGKVIDFLISVGTQVAMAMPSFLLGILLILIFGVVLNLFSTSKFVTFNENPMGFLKCLLLPAVAISMHEIAIIVKFLRSSIIEQFGEDYVRTAYSKGNKESAVIYNHVLKNALIPVITMFGLIVAEIIAGSLIVEQVFCLPGLGSLLISSISNRDFPLIQAIVIFIAFTVVTINFLVDIACQFIDPRIRVK